MCTSSYLICDLRWKGRVGGNEEGRDGEGSEEGEGVQGQVT